MNLPTIWQDVVQAYRDVIFALTVLRTPAAVACFVSSLGNIIETAFIPDDVSSSNQLLLRFLSGAAQQFFFTPYLIAVHRLIILGETDDRYRLNTRDLRFQKYFWLTVSFDFLNYLASFLAPLSLLLWPSPSAIDLLPVLQAIALIALFVWLILIFPAVAVDAPDATLRGASRDAKGHFWHTFFVIAVTHVPMFALLVFVAGFVQLNKLTDPFWSVVTNVMGGTIAIVMFTLLVAISSRLYIALTGRAKRSALAG